MECARHQTQLAIETLMVGVRHRAHVMLLYRSTCLCVTYDRLCHHLLSLDGGRHGGEVEEEGKKGKSLRQKNQRQGVRNEQTVRCASTSIDPLSCLVCLSCASTSRRVVSV